MKQLSFTSAPLAGEPGPVKSSFKDLLLGARRREKFYEARHRENTFYLLWMESPRMGALTAFPCVLAEKDRAPMVFDPGRNSAADQNNEAFLRRWDELSLPERREELIIRPLEEGEFHTLFRRYRDSR